MPNELILVVDDNPSNVRLVEFLLKKRGYRVEIAVDAASAVDAVARCVPDLVLMDVQLPGADGLQLTRQMKSDPRLQLVPIIVLTASAMKGDEERARAAGCDAYMTKPIDIKALTTLVASCLQGGP